MKRTEGSELHEAEKAATLQLDFTTEIYLYQYQQRFKFEPIALVPFNLKEDTSLLHSAEWLRKIRLNLSMTLERQRGLKS